MASKRSRTPLDDGGGDSKRRCTTGHRRGSRLRLNFNACFSDEVVLDIFSHLSYQELCTIQEVHSHWARLASDNTLWKRLFLIDHPSQRLRGSRGFSSRWVSESGPSGREIKPLPAKLRLTENQVDYFPFKWMYRVSRNWRQGTYKASKTDVGPLLTCFIGRCAVDVVPTGAPAHQSTRRAASTHARPHNQHLLLAGDLVIYASSGPSPEVVLQALGGKPHRVRAPSEVICLVLDQSTPGPPNLQDVRDHHFHLACFFATGGFTILSIPPSQPSNASEIYRSHLAVPVKRALYKHPLLVTLTADTEMSVWDVPSSSGRPPTLIQTFRSYSTFPPLTMSLVQAGDAWKLMTVYCSPVYPSHWLPAASEITIERKSKTSKVVGTRKSKSYVACHGWMTEDERQEMDQEWGRKMGNVEVVETDGKFVVAAGRDNTLQVYRVHYRGEFRLSFVRTLSGHTSRVEALKVADGRCVSVSSEGTLLVWDLEGGWSSGVSGQGEGSLRPRDLVFDERHAVSLVGDSLRIWRFDL